MLSAAGSVKQSQKDGYGIKNNNFINDGFHFEVECTRQQKPEDSTIDNPQYSKDNDETQIKSKKSTAALIESINGADVTADDFVVRKSKQFEVSYEYLVWGIFTLVTILCIVDRFVMKGDVVLERKGKRAT